MYHKSELKDVTIPNVTIAKFVLDRIKLYGSKTAVIENKTGREVTFKEIADDIFICAKGLIECGFKPGDVTFICSVNCIEYYYLFYASSIIGSVISTGNPQLTEREMLHQVKDSQSSRIVVSTLALPAVKKLLDANPGLVCDVFVISDEETYGFKNFKAIMNAGRESKIEDVILEDENPIDRRFVLPYSSGTTGRSKGVESSSRVFIAQVLQYTDPSLQHLTESDIVVHLLPMYHMWPLIMNLVFSLWVGATSIIMDRFHLRTYLDLLVKHKATMSYVVPPVAVLLAKNPIVEEYNLAYLRTLISAAAPLSEDIIVQVKERLDIPDFRQSYGMTEIGIVCFPPRDSCKHSSVGVLMPNTEAKVTSITSGELLGNGKEGELWFKGPTLLQSYLNKDMAEFLDENGWFRTGDTGYIDEKGFFFITDRIKELIKYKGHQVAPAELEALLLKHPAVADAAVVGTPDLEAGQLPTAYIVKRSNIVVTEDELCQFVASQVAPQKKLRGGVKFIEKIPKSAAGKILRRILRDGE